MSYKIRRLVRKSNSREGGFTLIEVLVALAILSIIAVGIYSALHSGIANTVNEDERATARSLAEAQMEYVKQLILDPRDEDEGGQNPPPTGEGVYDPDGTILSQYPGYEVRIDAATADGDRDKYLQLITVTVYHEGEKALELEGYKLAKYPGWKPVPEP